MAIQPHKRGHGQVAPPMQGLLQHMVSIKKQCGSLNIYLGRCELGLLFSKGKGGREGLSAPGDRCDSADADSVAVFVFEAWFFVSFSP